MVDPTSSTACWSLWLVIAVFTVVPVRTDAICVSDNSTNNTELDYRIKPDTPPSKGVIHSMSLLDGGRMLLVYPDLNELRLINWQGQANTTLSSLQVPSRPHMLAQLPNQKFLVSRYIDTKLWLVNISGDVLQVERELNTETDYFALCPGPNNTFLASVMSYRKGRVDQLDLQGRVLRTVFTDTTDQFRFIFRIKRYGDNLYLFPLLGQPGIVSLTTGEVTTTIGQTDLATLGFSHTYDLDYDSKGDAYLCVAGALCGEAKRCVVRIDGCGQVTVLPTFFSRPSQRWFCEDVISTANQLLINWIYIDQSGSYNSEITVQSLPH